MTLPVGIPGRAPGGGLEVVFVTEGSTFAPQLTFAEGSTAVVHWRMHDGSTLSGELNVNFGTAATRTHRATCARWQDLRVLNLGYDASDAGTDWDQIPLHPTQNVSAVRGLQAATGLERLAVSYCPLTELDVSGLARLIQLEAFNCTSMVAVRLGGCVALRRLCVEDNALTALDLTDQVDLLDLRGAVNAFDRILWPPGGAPNLWHLCVRDNVFAAPVVPDYSLFQSIFDLYIWNTRQAGTLKPYLRQGGTIWANDNEFTALDLSECRFGINRLLLSNNRLGVINWGGIVGFTEVDLSGNLLPQAQVDAALVHMSTHSVAAPGTINLSGTGNAAPSATGLAARDVLTGLGRTVTVNA